MGIVKEKSIKKIIIGIVISLIAVVVFLFVYTGRNYGSQAMNAMYLSAEFKGAYKVADGEWHPYVKGEHIPANKGDVTLKGYFQLFVPTTGEIVGKASEGTVIAFYFNHIGGEISENGEEFRPFDAEMTITGEEMCGVRYASEDMCGIMYTGYDCKGEEVTIKLKNPHKFGNAGAVDDFLNNLSTYGGAEFERDMLNLGNPQRIWGIVLILFAFMILGTSIFSMLIHIKYSKSLWFIGLAVFCAGIYFIFSAHGVIFFSKIIKFNTRMLGAAMMLYMLSVTALLAFQFKGKTRRVGEILVIVSVLSNMIFLLAPVFFNIKFYDTLPIWVMVQGIACLIMTWRLINEFFAGGKNEKIISAFGILPMIAFIVDAFGVGFGLWQGGFVSRSVFVIMFVIAIVLLLMVIPKNLNAATKARKLEAEKMILNAELAESRIAIMISQIQPHFIYNTLGTIEQLCVTEPKEASKLVRNFSLYLRGNFSELNNSKPIRFSQEMNHVKHYTDIEQIRFPDMTIQYDLRSVEFVLPALSVQPLVENAIKHGLMGLEEGGIVTISAYETESHYVVEVIDDGVGFDTDTERDEKKHVGIKNIRGRIEAMCNGTLEIESELGKGTKATIKIPKEATENDSNNS